MFYLTWSPNAISECSFIKWPHINSWTENTDQLIAWHWGHDKNWFGNFRRSYYAQYRDINQVLGDVIRKNVCKVGLFLFTFTQFARVLFCSVLQFLCWSINQIHEWIFTTGLRSICTLWVPSCCTIFSIHPSDTTHCISWLLFACGSFVTLSH